MIRAWHFVGKTLRDGSKIPRDGVWLKHPGEIVICWQGLHASRDAFDALQYAPGATLCLVDCDGEIIEQSDKLVCSARRIVTRMDATDMLRYFARMQAVSCLDKWNAPDVVCNYLMTGDESIMDAARASAWAATRDAEWAAARAAARDAARAAARAAAWDAARDAAWAAAWDDARAAARDAARAAARAAAWDAARAAARAAAWDAARASAWAATRAAAVDAAVNAARDAARAAAVNAARDAARAAARAAARDAAWAAAWAAARNDFNELVAECFGVSA